MPRDRGGKKQAAVRHAQGQVLLGALEARLLDQHRAVARRTSGPTSHPNPNARSPAMTPTSRPPFQRRARGLSSSSCAVNPMILFPYGSRTRRCAARLPRTGEPRARCAPAAAAPQSPATFEEFQHQQAAQAVADQVQGVGSRSPPKMRQGRGRWRPGPRSPKHNETRESGTPIAAIVCGAATRLQSR